MKVSARLAGWLPAILVILVTLALIVGEITNAGQRNWWGSHSLTTDTVSGLLVLMITILIVNQLINLRQARQRSHAVASQAAILVGQAALSTGAISSATSGSGDRNAASDGFRTYITMLLISAPVFIGEPAARHFLEQAQNLARVMADALELAPRSTDGTAVPGDGLDDAVQQLQSAAAPLLQGVRAEVRDSIQRLSRTAKE